MMPSLAITVSVIIPTYNRSAQLETTIRALGRQTWPPEQMEVLVVADGCSDNTIEVMQKLQLPFTLRLIEQPNQGASAARNRGAETARGKILLFIDDDIEATPELIRAHVNAHQAGPGQVVIGYLPVIVDGKNDFFEIQLRSWWEAMFQAMCQPGHRFSYTDLLSGNFSVEADLFNRVGGFLSGMRCHEDYEIGVRLLQAGGNFVFAADAIGFHHERTDLNRSLLRKYQEGLADVMLGRRYPELIPTLLMTKLMLFSLPASKLLKIFAFRWPAAGALIAAILKRSLVAFEKARLRRLWRRILDGLLAYWYWTGVAQELRSRAEADLFLKDAYKKLQAMSPDLVIDLELGLENAEQVLDSYRPTSVRLDFGVHTLGVIPCTPGTEPLRGYHLRYFLAREFAAPLLRVLSLEGKLVFPELSEILLAACDERQFP